MIWATTLGTAAIFLGSLAGQAPDRDTKPNGKGIGTLQHPPTPEQAVGNANRNSPVKTSGISYHGGPVMTNQAHIYFIWYGDWTGNTALTLLPYFASAIGGSPYYRINTTYNNGAGLSVPVGAQYQGSTAVTTYPYGKSLTDAQIRQIVLDSMTSGALVQDPDGIYFVLTSADVTASSGFCTTYCGWHTYSSMTVFGTSKVIKYSFVGNPDRCISACAAQSTSPNGNPGADGMASIIAHELEEAVTDPQLNAWYDSRGYENADKCAWKFGTVYVTGNGSYANMSIGASNLNFLIQQNWLNANGGSCALSY